MSDVLAQVLILGGSIFMLLAGIGVLRMPDVYMRLSTATKGSSLGIVLLVCGMVVAFPTLEVLLKVGAVLAFGFITSPISAHLVSRAAYFQGVALWEGTVRDELRGQYEMRDHQLASPEPEETLAGTILAEGDSERS